MTNKKDTKKWVVVKLGSKKIAWFPLKMACMVYMNKRDEIFNHRITLKVINKSQVFKKTNEADGQ